jgi:hypothetical protein
MDQNPQVSGSGFDAWQRKVDAEVDRRVGCSLSDLIEVPLREPRCEECGTVARPPRSSRQVAAAMRRAGRTRQAKATCDYVGCQEPTEYLVAPANARATPPMVCCALHFESITRILLAQGSCRVEAMRRSL